jgi:hypothetical protein
MRFSLIGLIRLTGMLGLAVCLTAVGLARLEPTPTRFRVSAPPPYDVVNGFLLNTIPGDSQWLDVETGQMRKVPIPEGDRIEYASCSPWQDDEGCQVVGRWTHRVPNRFGMRAREFGMARYAIPSGRVLDQIPMEVVPASQPCWFPGTAAKVLFAGVDGRLYRVDFDGKGDDGDGPRPVPLVWRLPAPGTSMLIRDPVWPSDPRMGGRLIVSLSYWTGGTQNRLSPSRLWWLKLDRSGLSVVEAGVLTDPAMPTAGESRRDDERFPNVVITPNGSPLLAYLSQPRETSLWDLRLTPLRFEAATGRPTARSEESRMLTHRHLTTFPPFSADGSHVFAIVRGQGCGRNSSAEVERYTTSEPETPALDTTAAAGLTPPKG